MNMCHLFWRQLRDFKSLARPALLGRFLVEEVSVVSHRGPAGKLQA